MKTIAVLLLLVAAPLLCQQGMGSGSKAPLARRSPLLAGAVKPPNLVFRDVASAWGVTAANSYGGATTKRSILEMTGNGVALIDYDNDGRLDIFLPNGASAPAVLYRNLGAGRFTDAAREAGLVTSGWAQGACAGDFDNDGSTDLFLTRYGSNQLWRNANGRFRDVTVAAGLATPGEFFHTGCTFTDYDRDGRLDLFVSNYAGFSLRTASAARPLASPFCSWRGLDVFCGPRGLPTGLSHLFHNEGSGRFRDVSMSAGIRTVEGLHYGLGAVASDFDDDGWPDLYVACDSTPSLLFHNQRNGTFKEAAVGAGVAYGEHGEEQGGMGVAVFDYDNDAKPDILRTNFIDETTALYHNDGGLFFSDATVSGGFAVNTAFVSWGVVPVDFDQDGWRDLVIANGHIYPELATRKAAGSADKFEQPRLVYWNARNGAFADVSAGAGEAITMPRCSRGLAAGDLDGDGVPELVVVNQNARPMVLRNETEARGNWLIVKLVGTRSNRGAIGARVTLAAPHQHAEVRSGGSYLSQSDLRLHFGVGAAAVIDRIEVRWPSGARQSVAAVKTNQVITITENAP